jgi:hypothetical protein
MTTSGVSAAILDSTTGRLMTIRGWNTLAGVSDVHISRSTGMKTSFGLLFVTGDRYESILEYQN